MIGLKEEFTLQHLIGNIGHLRKASSPLLFIDILVCVDFQPHIMAASIESTNAIEAPNATPASSLSAWATKRDWIQHQALIGQLYKDRTLSEVMEIMERQHGFRATCGFLTVLMI